jgi:hypothetical protein
MWLCPGRGSRRDAGAAPAVVDARRLALAARRNCGHDRCNIVERDGRPEGGGFMDWGVFVQQLINGLTLGSIYGLIAIGYTMVFGSSPSATRWCSASSAW